MPTATADMTNEQRSAEEVAEFKAHQWQTYFAYHKATECYVQRIARLYHGDTITTWMGDELAKVTEAFPPFHDNFGGLRQNFRAKGINGLTYSGTAYLTSGDYVRMRAVKA